MKQEITRYANKMKACTSMTDLLMTMASWNAFCERQTLTEEERAIVDAEYIKAEKRLITQVKPSLW